MSTFTFLTLTINETVYDDIVPRTYRLDPETEELFYGEDLEEGLVVLLEYWQDRADEKMTASPNNAGNLLVQNRWCRVTDLRRQGDNSYFIGVYKDGHKTIRSSSNTTGWYVKKDSIPEPTKPELRHPSFRGIPRIVGNIPTSDGYAKPSAPPVKPR